MLKLGTSRHHQGFLDKIDNLQAVGCFALTELGYGNNAVEMETTATFDKVCITWFDVVERVIALKIICVFDSIGVES